MKNTLFSGLILCCVFLSAGRAGAETVNVYTSANFAPLVVAGTRGMYPDLINYLNRQKLGKLTFKLRYLPRKRLQMRLEEGSLDGIVIGMMPDWFDDPAQKKYLWSTPFAFDRYVLASRAAEPLTADIPLPGASIGVTLGYAYPALDAWLHKSGAQRRVGVSDTANLEKLLLGRIDGVIVAESIARLFVKSTKEGPALRIVPLPGPVTERRFLVPRAQAAVFDKLAPVIRKLKDDPAWQRALGQYQ